MGGEVTPSQRTKLVAAVAATVGVVAVALRSGDHSERVSDTQTDGAASMSADLHRVTDLLSAPVVPGAEIETGINLPVGGRVSDVVAAGPFAIISQSHTDNKDATWFALVVRNDGPTAMPFVGFAEFTVP